MTEKIGTWLAGIGFVVMIPVSVTTWVWTSDVRWFLTFAAIGITVLFIGAAMGGMTQKK